MKLVAGRTSISVAVLLVAVLLVASAALAADRPPRDASARPPSAILTGPGWERFDPAVRPPGINGAAMAHDPVGARVVRFGGYVGPTRPRRRGA